jgi:hypothetical protein
MKFLPADFSNDIPEFTDEELEEELAACDRENAAKRAAAARVKDRGALPLQDAAVTPRRISK